MQETAERLAPSRGRFDLGFFPHLHPGGGGGFPGGGAREVGLVGGFGGLVAARLFLVLLLVG